MLSLISKQNQRFIKSLSALPSLLILMMIIRGLAFWLSGSETDPDFYWQNGIKIVWMGLRFDLLVMGFFFIPVWVFSWGLSFKWVARYLQLIWIMICVMDFSDIHFFVKNSSHRYWAEHVLAPYWSDFRHWWLTENATAIFLVTAIFILILSIGVKNIWASLVTSPEQDRGVLGRDLDGNGMKAFLRGTFNFLWPILLVAAMARGTFTQHHLRLEDSFVTGSSTLNEIVLNPQWTFDKVRP